ncbi:MAG: lipid II flippase MurJ, partial [Gordonibacter sp.]
VANNVIVIVTFVLYAVVAPHDQQLALYLIAFGNPLGVFVQLAIQLPALKKNGIRVRPRINFRDPALRETLGIGVPAVFVMLCSLVVVSVQNAASYGFADNGPSVLLYARQWFTLPYAFLAVPITTAMFTELADMQAEGNIEGVKRGIIGGTNQILFFMIPFALYLMVFALPLVSLYHAGAFTMDNVSSIATYMSVLAFALPVYGVNTYLQKIFSSLRKMGVFAAFNFVAGAVQIGLTMYGAANVDRFPIEIIAVAEVLFYVVADLCLFIYLRRHLGAFGLRSVVKAVFSGVVFGGLGAAAGGGVLYALTTFVAPLSGSIPQALAYVMAGGIVALAITFGLSIKLRVPEAAFVGNIFAKVGRRLGRGRS